MAWLFATQICLDVVLSISWFVVGRRRIAALWAVIALVNVASLILTLRR